MTKDDVKIKGKLFFAKADAARCVVLAHGLPAPHMASPEPNDEGYAGLARRICPLGYDVAIFNFRGTGESGGNLEVDKWPLDLIAVLGRLDDHYGPRSDYIVVGSSAGGATSIVTAERDERIHRLITFAAPADYEFLGVNDDPGDWFEIYRKAGMIRAGYDGDADSWAAGFLKIVPKDAMPYCKAKEITLLHGSEDETVPPEHLEILAKASGGRAKAVMLPGVAHQMRRDERAVKALLKELFAR